MDKTPVSDELLVSILRVLNNEQKTKGVKRGISSVKKGNAPGEIIFSTKVGERACVVSEDGNFFYFTAPSGKFRRARKDEFLTELSEKQV